MAFRPFGQRGRYQSLGHMIRTLPARQLKFFWLAIFSTFAMFGFAIDIMSRGREPATLLVMNSVASGALSVLYAIASMPARRARYLTVLAAHMTYVFTVPRAFGLLTAAPPGRLLVDAIGVMATVLTGYSMFLRFINITAARYLRAETEIAVAHGIHQVLVPAIDRQIGDYEFFGWSIASGEVGGDLVDVADEGGRWLAYVADVSGHGVGPGVIMGMFKSALRMRARGPGTIGALLDDVHAVLMPLKESATFVTVACVRVIDACQIDCAVAGHLPILRVRHGTVEELTEPQLALGMFERTTFTSWTAATEPGDLLALLTDGLIEVFDPENRELGFDWAKGVLAADANRPLSAIADRLLAEARQHGPQIDDQTLLLIRRQPS